MSNRLLFASTALARPAIIRRAFTRDNLMTFDQRTLDSTGSFLIGELERLDQTMHEPLASVTWQRDIDLREDVSIADEVSSFTNSTFASAGGINPTGKAWISKDANAITGIALDIGKTAQPLNLWAMEIKYTIPELESAIKVGRPIDAQKLMGMQLKYQMDIDEQVYIGDTDLNVKGLVNSAAVTNSANVSAGAGGTTAWTTKTPDEILADVQELENSVWQASGYSQAPRELRLPPARYSYINNQKVSIAGERSILTYLRENSLCNAVNGTPLNIQPLKWLTDRGATSTQRMVAYTRQMDRVRFPLVPLQRTPLEYRSLFHITTYYGRLGVVEIVYPETLGYRDGI